MKKALFFMMLASVMCGLTSCWKLGFISVDDQNGEPLTYGNCSFQANGGTINAKVDTYGDWWVSEKDDWLSVSPSNGHGKTNIQIICEPNDEGSKRWGSIKFSTAEDSYLAAVAQDNAPE